MSRPASVPVDSSTTGWVGRLNANFAKLLDAPLPIAQVALVGDLTAFNPKIYKDCLILVGQTLYKSDGTAWEPYRELLTFVADLVPGVATISDIKTAFNALLTDMKAKSWMLNT